MSLQDSYDANAECISTMGNLICDCRAGFAGNGTFCIDINECTSLSNACNESGATCENTFGGYNCRCNVGYMNTYNSLTSLSLCSGKQHSVTYSMDFDAQYMCAWDNNYKFSTDIDECKLGEHNCSANATCENTVGSFNCSCRDGFEGDGMNCYGKYAMSMFYIC